MHWKQIAIVSAFLWSAWLSPNPVGAQIIECKEQKAGSVGFVGVDRLDSVLRKRAQRNRYLPKIPGYRVQTMTASNRKVIHERKEELKEEFPEAGFYVVYESPYFKLRLGDFRSHNEALRLYHRLREAHISAFIVPDTIRYPALPLDEKQ
jgi:hypothetical protein